VVPNGQTDFIQDEVLEKTKMPFCQAFKSGYVDVLLCILAYFTILVVAFLRGGHGLVSIIGINFCSTPGWLLFAACQFVCLGCSMVCFWRHKRELLDDEGKGPEEYHRKKKNMIILLFASYGSGIGAGTLGIGGGMIMNPVLLSMGFLTEVAAAVAGFSVLFTSSSTTSQFAIAGAIDINQAFIF